MAIFLLRKIQNKKIKNIFNSTGFVVLHLQQHGIRGAASRAGLRVSGPLTYCCLLVRLINTIIKINNSFKSSRLNGFIILLIVNCSMNNTKTFREIIEKGPLRTALFKLFK